MKLEVVNATPALTSAVLSASVPVLETISASFFGVPISVWVSCFAGALFSTTFFPPESKISRPVSVVLTAVGGVYVTGLAVAHLPFASVAPPGAGFVISGALPLALPALAAVIKQAPTAIWEKFFGKKDFGKKEGG